MGGWFLCSLVGLSVLRAETDLPRPSVGADLPGPLCPLGKGVHCPAKDMAAAADWKAASPGNFAPMFPECGGRLARPPWCMCQGRGRVSGGCSRRGGSQEMGHGFKAQRGRNGV